MRATSRRAARPPRIADLRLWLRILTIHKLVNNEVRRRLREQFGMSLSRFDLLAQLDGATQRHAHGRIVETPDGDDRQYHRPRRRIGGGKDWSSAWPIRSTAAPRWRA